MPSTAEGLPAEPARADAGWGELIVLSGPLTGTRWPLHSPAIVLGQNDGCDYRLDDADVSPVHAVLMMTAEGAVLRDLHSDGGTYVNGEVVAQATVRDGDLIALGSYQFEFHRLALTPEEARLEERRQALARQQAQLDAQFEARQRQLVRLRNEAHAATEALRAERKSYKKYVGQTIISLDAARTEVARAQEEAERERRRLLRVHQLLKKRTERHCQEERRALDERALQLDNWQEQLASIGRKLQREREELSQARVRLNTDVELARRRLEEGWHELKQAQHQFEEERNRQQAELEQSMRGLESRVAQHEAQERELAHERRQWSERLRALQAESEGLENRIGNQRRKLHELEEELNRLAAAKERLQSRAPQPVVTLTPLPDDIAEQMKAREEAVREAGKQVGARMNMLNELALQLHEQQQQLVEQALQLQAATERWQQEREALVGELQPLAVALEERERQLIRREQTVESTRREQQERREALDRWQRELYARQAQLEIRRTEWERERERLLAELESRDAAANRETPPSRLEQENYLLQWKLLCLQAQRGTYERHIRTLSDEVERLACVLIDEELPSLTFPASRAA